MRKEIKYQLPYFEDGEENKIELKIYFVSYSMLINYSDNKEIAMQAVMSNNEMAIITEEIAIEKDEKSDGYEERIIDLELKYKGCVDSIMEFNYNGFFDERFKIITKLLTDNGYKNNDMLMNVDFWQEKVDPADFADFLEVAIYKDSDDKKKV